MPDIRVGFRMRAKYGKMGLAWVLGLWASTILPGVDLHGRTPGIKLATLLGTAVVSGVVWLLYGTVEKLLRLLTRQVGPRVVITDALARWLALPIVVAIFSLQFWLTVLLAGELGLGFKVSGFWPVVGGSVITNLVYMTVASFHIDVTAGD